ncbi:hypothetical protein WJX79_009295 [Trebouxia sp. C0005]
MLNAVVDHSCLPSLRQQPHLRLHSKSLLNVSQPSRRFCKRSLRCWNSKQQKRAHRTRYQPVEDTATEAMAPYQKSPLGRHNHLAKQRTERVVEMQQVPMWAAT